MTQEQPRWRFARMSAWQPNSNPVLGEFFSAASDLPERLVREAIQNSMDARDGDEPVRVRFTFSNEQDALSRESAKPYLDGLEPHILAVAASDDDGNENSPDDPRTALNRPLSWLAVEDFGTFGLSGDIRSNDIEEKGNHFWGFFRQSGISAKDEDKAGSWGLGKWVFPDASAINSYIAVTEPSDQRRVLLMGATVLKTHLVDGVKYPPEGYFTPTDTGVQDSPPLPVNSDADPDEFILTALETFGLDRTAAPGLSVIVLYPKSELNPEAIARAVITQWFLPVVRGDLHVEVVHPDSGITVISKDTIANKVDLLAGAPPDSKRIDESPEWFRKVIKLAAWAAAPNREHEELPVPAARSDALSGLDADSLRERYEQGEPLAFRLTFPQGLQRKGEERRYGTEASFCIYLEQDRDLSVGHDYFVRGHLRIPNMDEIKGQKARALVVIDDKSALAHLLRDSEGPAHAAWYAREARLLENWPRESRRVSDVRHATERILQRLVERPAESLTHALAHWFPASTPTSRGSQAGSAEGGGTVPPPHPPGPGPRPIEIVRASDGFAIRARKDASGLVGTDWTVKFAYDSTGRGGPFRQFEKSVKDGTPDFSLSNGQLRVEEDGCTHSRTGENEFALRVSANSFKIAVSGFDSRRDVIVDVQPVTEAEAEEDAA